MKILFFTGKGGVGKSTLAAATAWQLSKKHRVLVVSLDPAHNLGDIFGLTPAFPELELPGVRVKTWDSQDIGQHVNRDSASKIEPCSVSGTPDRYF